MSHELQSKLRRLPSVSALLTTQAIAQAATRHDHDRIVSALQAVIAAARDRLRDGADQVPDASELAAQAIEQLAAEGRCRLRRVVNATGVVLNTNLGRAPLAPEAIESLGEIAIGYSNLEFDLETGRRGSRYDHLEALLCRLTGAEGALVVNNNAAAVLLVVDTFARGREVVISRGQLVEIGGSFRIPEVVTASGGRLVEVGTTNKTHLGDYERAVTDQTAMLMRCHTSNYRIVGFTSEVTPQEMVALAQACGVLAVEDLGSGMLVDLSLYGLPKEPTVQETVAAGMDLVTFSGDKLLGGPQAGLIVGRRDLIGRLKRNPLLRALRQDKLTLSTLERTLRCYLDPSRALAMVPTLRMLVTPESELCTAAEQLAGHLMAQFGSALTVSTAPGLSQVGGGSLPATDLPTMLVAIRHPAWSAQTLAERLRSVDPPVVARIEQEQLLLDPRTLLAGDDERILTAFATVLAHA